MLILMIVLALLATTIAVLPLVVALRYESRLQAIPVTGRHPAGR